MDSDAVTLFFALLAVLAQFMVLAVVVVWLGSRVWAPFASAQRWMVEVVGPQALTLAAIVALVSTAGSLYFSEVANFVPCRLCWFQRIAMYPLVVVLGVGAVRRDLGARLPAAILAAIGAIISIWHLLVERYPTLESSSCDPLNPCSFKWVNEFGYVTIPAMALSGFALIGVLLALARPHSSEDPS